MPITALPSSVHFSGNASANKRRREDGQAESSTSGKRQREESSKDTIVVGGTIPQTVVERSIPQTMRSQPIDVEPHPQAGHGSNHSSAHRLSPAQDAPSLTQRDPRHTYKWLKWMNAQGPDGQQAIRNLLETAVDRKKVIVEQEANNKLNVLKDEEATARQKSNALKQAIKDREALAKLNASASKMAIEELRTIDNQEAIAIGLQETVDNQEATALQEAKQKALKDQEAIAKHEAIALRKADDQKVVAQQKDSVLQEAFHKMKGIVVHKKKIDAMHEALDTLKTTEGQQATAAVLREEFGRNNPMKASAQYLISAGLVSPDGTTTAPVLEDVLKNVYEIVHVDDAGKITLTQPRQPLNRLA
jgi:hypothetical protein